MKLHYARLKEAESDQLQDLGHQDDSVASFLGGQHIYKFLLTSGLFCLLAQS
jgi:hypothetical protein